MVCSGVSCPLSAGAVCRSETQRNQHLLHSQRNLGSASLLSQWIASFCLHGFYVTCISEERRAGKSQVLTLCSSARATHRDSNGVQRGVLSSFRWSPR